MLNIRKVIAVQNYGPSGTSLMHSLLDDHPQIISTLMLQDYGCYYVLWDNSIAHNPTAKNAFNIIKKELYSLFNADYGDQTFKEMGEGRNERLEVSENEFYHHFINYFSNQEFITRRQFIIGTFVAYNLCHGRSFNDDAIICFPIHNQSKQYAQYLVEDFKEVYFLHMVREPVTNMGSQIKYIEKSDRNIDLFKSFLECVVMQILLEKAYHFLYKPVQVYGKKPYFKDHISSDSVVISRAVRLEDVHLKPQETLQKICDWIGFNWHDCLMKSTFMGKKWHNRVGFIRASGFDKRIIEQKHEKYFNWFDRYRLRLLSKSEQEYFGYKSFSIFDKIAFYLFLPLVILIPFKVELNLQRIKNRLDNLLALNFLENDDEEWIARNYNKRSFIDNLKNKLNAKYDSAAVESIIKWVKENHHRNHFTQNLVKLLKEYKTKVADPNAKKWILENYPPAQPLKNGKETNRARFKCFMVYYKLLLLRVIKNYFNSRRDMFCIWYLRSFNCDKIDYIKLL